MKILMEYNENFGSVGEFLEYIGLIKRVFEFNEEAAIKMTEPNENIFPHFSYSGDLTCCFMWRKTSEGWEYWASLCDYLEPDDDEEIEIEKEEE